MSRLDLLIYPELNAFEPRERAAALKRARRQPCDLLELAGMACAVVLVTSVTSYGAPTGVVEQFAGALAAFLVALPLLAVTAGPFLHRRTRRVLRRELRQRTGEAR